MTSHDHDGLTSLTDDIMIASAQRHAAEIRRGQVLGAICLLLAGTIAVLLLAIVM